MRVGLTLHSRCDLCESRVQATSRIRECELAMLRLGWSMVCASKLSPAGALCSVDFALCVLRCVFVFHVRTGESRHKTASTLYLRVGV